MRSCHGGLPSSHRVLSSAKHPYSERQEMPPGPFTSRTCAKSVSAAFICEEDKEIQSCCLSCMAFQRRPHYFAVCHLWQPRLWAADSSHKSSDAQAPNYPKGWRNRATLLCDDRCRQILLGGEGVLCLCPGPCTFAPTAGKSALPIWLCCEDPERAAQRSLAFSFPLGSSRADTCRDGMHLLERVGSSPSSDQLFLCTWAHPNCLISHTVSWNLGENITIFGGRGEDDGGRRRWGENKGLQIRLKKIYLL